MSPTTSSPSGEALIPIVVTSADEAATRRWQVLLASNGMRIYRPGNEFLHSELPAIAVRVEAADVWMSWTVPDLDTPVINKLVDEIQALSTGWADRPNAPERTAERYAMWKRWEVAMLAAGFALPGFPGDVRWISFTEAGPDWRTVADTAAAVIREESWQRFRGASLPPAGTASS